MAKLTLDFEPEFEFVLYGISSHIKNYKFIWNINTNLNINFERKQDLELVNSENQIHYFPVYSYQDEEENTFCDIIGNRSSIATYLIPEQKQFDYLLLLNEPIQEQVLERITEGIKELKAVNIIFQIDPNSLKSKQNLLL